MASPTSCQKVRRDRYIGILAVFVGHIPSVWVCQHEIVGGGRGQSGSYAHGIWVGRGWVKNLINRLHSGGQSYAASGVSFHPEIP